MIPDDHRAAPVLPFQPDAPAGFLIQHHSTVPGHGPTPAQRVQSSHRLNALEVFELYITTGRFAEAAIMLDKGDD